MSRSKSPPDFKAIRAKAHKHHVKAMEHSAFAMMGRGDPEYLKSRAWYREKLALSLWLKCPDFTGLERTMMLRSAAVVARDAGEILEAYRFSALCLLSTPDGHEEDQIREVVESLEKLS